MERQEFITYLLNDYEDNGVLENYVLIEKAYRLAQKLNSSEGETISNIIEAYEKTIEEDNACFFYDDGWFDVIDFLTEFAPKESGFEYTLEPFDFKFNGVSIFDIHKFYGELEKEVKGGEDEK